MARSLIEANAAIGRIRAMPYGRARSEAAEREVRRIEREGPDAARAYALTSLVESLTWGDEYDKAFLPFTRLLRWWDEHPELFDHYDQSVLFWEFGWIMADLPQIPTVGKAQIEAVLDDMERRFALANRGMERVYCARMDWKLITGDPDHAETFARWLTFPLDDEDSCAACHESLRGEYLMWRGDRGQGLAVLEDAVLGGMECSREPASMLTDLAIAYLEDGRLDKVRETVPKALAELKRAVSTSLSSSHARIFEIYCRTLRPELALNTLAERTRDLEVGTPYRRLLVLRRLVAGTSALLGAGYGDYPVAVKPLPVATIGELQAWSLERALDFTAQFDRRNGTDEQSKRLAAALAAQVMTAAPMDFAVPSAPTPPGVTERLAEALAEPFDAPSNVLDAPVQPGRPSRLEAERLFRNGTPLLAAKAFEAAAEEAQKEGYLRESGWAWAEAAHCHQVAGHPGVAARFYARALARLRAADVPVEELARVVVAWAPVVRGVDWDTFLDEALEASALLPTIVSDRPGGPNLSEVAAFGLTYRPLRRGLKARADIDDAVARVMATWGNEDERDEALLRARSAAEVYASIGAAEDAAHADWLVGRLAYDLGSPDEAVQALDSALGRFRRLGRRVRGQAAEVAGELAGLHRELGDPDAADRVIDSLF